MFETCKYELLNLKNWLQKKYFLLYSMIILLPGAIRISFFSDLGERLIKLFSETALNLFKICKNYNWCLLFACAFTRLKYVGYVLIQLYFGICFTLSLRQKINFLRF